jgi:hypothetical protein
MVRFSFICSVSSRPSVRVRPNFRVKVKVNLG